MVKIVKSPGNERLNNLNDPVLNVLISYMFQQLGAILREFAVRRNTK